MWALSYASPSGPLHLLIPKRTKTPRAVSANSQPPPQHEFGGLGRTILTALESNPKPINTKTPQQKKPKREEEEEEGKQISGSDVLWAMQKAAAMKNKSKKKKISKGLSSMGGHREEDVAGDYSNVRPLCIKSEWGPKLDELEKSLQELYETK